MKLDAIQKLEIAKTIQAKPEIENKLIANILGVSAKNVMAIRYWLDTKGVEEYINKLEADAKKINEQYKHLEDTFKNKKGIQKQKARDIMTKVIGQSKLKRGKVLTLPCADWNIEKMIQKQVSQLFTYVACERDVQTLAKMVQNLHLVGKKNEVYHGLIGDKMFEASEDEYSHIIADYCGTLDKAKKELIHACNNNIVKVGGTIAVTLLKARCSKETVGKLNKYTSKLSGEEIRENDNERGIKLFFQNLANITNFEVIEEFCYQDTSPMILIVLKRTH
jgi:hypothetical protein